MSREVLAAITCSLSTERSLVDPSSTPLFSVLLKALALGLGLGLAVAYGLEKLDDKIHSPEQLEEVTGLTPLGIIPKVAKVDEEFNDTGSALAEAYRSLCTALQFTTENGLPKSLGDHERWSRGREVFHRAGHSEAFC